MSTTLAVPSSFPLPDTRPSLVLLPPVTRPRWTDVVARYLVQAGPEFDADAIARAATREARVYVQPPLVRGIARRLGLT